MIRPIQLLSRCYGCLSQHWPQHALHRHGVAAMRVGIEEVAIARPLASIKRRYVPIVLTSNFHAKRVELDAVVLLFSVHLCFLDLADGTGIDHVASLSDTRFRKQKSTQREAPRCLGCSDAIDYCLSAQGWFPPRYDPTLLV